MAGSIEVNHIVAVSTRFGSREPVWPPSGDVGTLSRRARSVLIMMD
jgi:hypothetical protein